jgi:hypothetical protein
VFNVGANIEQLICRRWGSVDFAKIYVFEMGNAKARRKTLL